jgi:hypothetical protein
LCITPDGQYIVAAESSQSRLSMFRVSDGSFVKYIGVGVVGDGDRDVEFSSNGDLLVADCRKKRVFVFSASTYSLLRSWGMQDDADGQSLHPISLVLAGSKLYVLDASCARVQVFE